MPYIHINKDCPFGQVTCTSKCALFMEKRQCCAFVVIATAACGKTKKTKKKEAK